MTRIIVKFYFDKEIRVLGLLIAWFSWLVGLFSFSIWMFLLSLLVGIVLFTTLYEVTLNKREGYYQRALYSLGLRFGKKRPFVKIESCLIIKGTYTDLYMVGPFGISSDGDLYHAFLKFSHGEVLQIGSDKSRSKLLEKINAFRFDFNFAIIDKDDELQPKDNYTLIKESIPTHKIGKDLVITGIVSFIFGIASIFNEGFGFCFVNSIVQSCYLRRIHKDSKNQKEERRN